MKNVIVAGDVTLDCNIARSSEPNADKVWSGGIAARLYPQRGGAALLAELIRTTLGSRAQLYTPHLQSTAALLLGSARTHSYASWRRYDKVWRVSEFLGLDCAEPTEALFFDPGKRPIHLVVLDDANLGFRRTRSAWPRRTPQSWIVLKTSGVPGQGVLFETLLKDHAKRMVVLASADDLRQGNIRVGRGISWEQTAEDLAWEFGHNNELEDLARCAAVVVTFPGAGAFLASRGEYRLFFDPLSMEDQCFPPAQGGMVGYASCMAAAIASEIVNEPKSPNLGSAIGAGLSAMRRLYEVGYGADTDDAIKANLAFPFRSVAAEIAKPARSFAEVAVPAGAANWSVLADNPSGFHTLALEIAREGERAVKNIPVCKIGELTAIDRREIESYQSIRNLIGEYTRSRKDKPISIAVFGPPGSGKSFGVKELAKNLGVKEAEFNLSQMDSPGDLASAFHRVRDIGLTGKTPLVFWDEFDTRGFQWLASFLAPMQDGSFRENGVVHPIGRAIFVFAGGVCHSMEHFRTEVNRHDVKGADFLSRLRGYLDILSLNPSPPAVDRSYPIRRAFALRGLLNKRKQAGLRIDAGILNALLEVSAYKHGVRSIEAILEMSALEGRSAFEQSSLPSRNLLDLHVNALEFEALVKMEEDIEAMAGLLHEAYSLDLEAHGGVPQPYASLPEHEKEQNRENVRDIPRKLAIARAAIALSRRSATPPALPEESIGELARLEHERWMQLKLRQGWRHATNTDKNKKLHQDIVPWDQLDERAREKDRVVIRAIPGILSQCGYTIIPATS